MPIKSKAAALISVPVEKKKSIEKEVEEWSIPNSMNFREKLILFFRFSGLVWKEKVKESLRGVSKRFLWKREKGSARTKS